jgi:hypothetical protein
VPGARRRRGQARRLAAEVAPWCGSTACTPPVDRRQNPRAGLAAGVARRRQARRIRDEVIAGLPGQSGQARDGGQRLPGDAQSEPARALSALGRPDNNRDFYASNMLETAAINRVFYQRWTPQIVWPPPDGAARRGDLHAAVPRPGNRWSSRW